MSVAAAEAWASKWRGEGGPVDHPMSRDNQPMSWWQESRWELLAYYTHLMAYTAYNVEIKNRITVLRIRA